MTLEERIELCMDKLENLTADMLGVNPKEVNDGSDTLDLLSSIFSFSMHCVELIWRLDKLGVNVFLLDDDGKYDRLAEEFSDMLHGRIATEVKKEEGS